jgi:murein DD-endopeptidase MepM/ murein hydrolase activator NlpD
MIRGLILALALASPAGAFELALPVDCALGETCYIQQYPDRDPGPEARDFTCGPLSYEGHDGTDFALPTRAAMAEGVPVIASAPGTVMGVRDGVEDFAPAIPGKECGNGVVIDHGAGWETQYCHLRKGSVVVKAGDLVTLGQTLGLVGQSGLAAFPHLHLSVREKGQDRDPFASGTEGCGGSEGDLWAKDLRYQPGGLLEIGLADGVPEFDAIKAGLASPDLPATAPALVIWAYVFGPRAGDALLFSLTGPEGAVVTERVQLEKTQALAFRATGRKLRAQNWPEGRYRGEVRLMRGAVELGQKTLDITLAP